MSEPSPLPAPGWYPDPAGTNRRRWWDGRAWTDSFADGGWDGTIEQRPLGAGAHVNTPFIWILVLLPLVSVAAFLTWDVQDYVRRALEGPAGSLSAMAQPGYLLLQATSLLVYAATVVLAYLDWRALTRMGVVKPFHWAWAFLTVVYVIGRPVVLRRRVHAGLAPLWTFLAVWVVSIVVSSVKLAVVFGALASTLAHLPTS